MAGPAKDNPLPRAAYTAAEVAEALGVSENTVYRLMNENVIPSTHISPKRRVIPAVAFQRYVAALNEQAAAS